MSNADRSWPIRSIAAGAAGTAALTLYYDVERRLRPRHRGPLDYDDSLVPGKIVASIMHLPHVTDREDEDLGLALRRRLGEPRASAIFGATLMSATFSLFPLLGRTPPPWRWPPDVMATCLASHASYVAAVAAVDDSVRRA